MTALNTNINRVYETPNDSNAIPVAANAKIYQGSLVGRDADGYGRSLQAGDAAMGFAKDAIDNATGANGEKTAELKAKGKVSLFIPGIALADAGRKVYASDDNTFTLAAEGNSFVGFIARFERADYAIVAFDFFYGDETETEPAPAPAPAAEPTQNEGE